MKILSIAWYKIFPPEYGGQKGIALFNKYLARHYPLICLCSKNNERAIDQGYKILPILPVHKFQFFHPGVIRKIRSIAEKEKITHIILEHPYHGLAAYFTRKATGVKIIIHAHNIESERFRKMGAWWWRILRLYEKWVLKKSDLIAFKTNEDLSFAVSHYGAAPEKCMLLPYGIDPERKNPVPDAKTLIRERHHISSQEKILLFSGTLDIKTNANAVHAIFKKIVPLLSENKFNYKVIITGRNHHPSFSYLTRLSHPSVIMAGEITDIENYFAAADVFINPVSETTGVQTKTIEALSYNLNVVSFCNTLNGIDKTLCSGKVFIAGKNNFNDFANRITEATLTDAMATPVEFTNAYSFPACIEKFAARLKSL